MKGELIDYSDWEFGRVAGFPTLFAAGNVVTGKGNIVASRKHAKYVSEQAVEQYLGLVESDETVRQGVAKPESHAEGVANGIAAELDGQPAADPAQIEAALERVRRRQQDVGYDAGYKSWIEKAGRPC